MVDFKLTVSDAKGRSVTKELKDSDGAALLGAGLGAEIDASIAGLAGKMKITGGSDRSGVPMRRDVHGAARKYVLLSKGVGLQDAERGQRVRKLVRGGQVSEEIYQINCRLDGQLPDAADAGQKEESGGGKKE